ncbi:MAG: hypothetical protein FJ276_02430 [Planctomycetes bacterium]|nr:hypothetical protein [Planctomycetota bacterium]
MSPRDTTLLLLLLAAAGNLAGAEPIPIGSPGFPPSSVDAAGRLVEDWGTVDIQLSGEGIVDGQARLSPIKLDDVIPAAQAVSEHGAVRMTRTVYRAPIFPEGVDVLQVGLSGTGEKSVDVLMTLDISAGVQLGRRTARIGGRTVLVLPSDAAASQQLLDWGYYDESVSLPGWGKPEGKCDPAFTNIRAGMGGVPIVYQFTVAPGSQADVVLGLCESHWAEAGQRPLRCQVEGAAIQTVDPVAKWGQHKPGTLLFRARDANGDGRLEVSVRPAPRAPDRNPILNVIWLFAPGESPPLEKLIAGQCNDLALRYVDVGGQNDQSVFPPGKLEFRVRLEKDGTQELTFLVACTGGSAPVPELSDWDNDSLLRAARDVWRDWPKDH